jgi:cell division protease FtsH
LYERDDYSRLLIFVSGNLDEAYSYSKNVNETDISADVLHEHSLRISLLDIKKALERRFKPEQIARFGNIHVIYPSLSQQSYKTIISKKVESIALRVKGQFGITIEVDDSIKELIYENGVFPVQGTRPVFSTVKEILENNIPEVVMKLVVSNLKKGTIYYRDEHIYCRTSKEEEAVKIHYVGDLSKLRAEKRKNKDLTIYVSVHEAGHAVAYGILFGKCPTQIVASAISNNKEGFIGKHRHCETKEMLENEIAVCLAGRCAEELIFGDNKITSGASSDLVVATNLANHMIRNLAMSDFCSVRAIPEAEGANSYNNDTDETNDVIEKMVSEMYEKAHNILEDNMHFLSSVSKQLSDNGQLSQQEFKLIGHQFGYEFEEIDAKTVLYPNFNEIFNDFQNKLPMRVSYE